MKPAGAIVAALVSALALLSSACGNSCQSTVQTTAMPVLAAGSFDGADIDQANHRLFLADRTAQGVDVVDVSGSTPRFASTVKLAAAPNGVAFAPDQRRLYAGLGDGTVAVIDAGSLQVVDTIKVDATSIDLVDYSARTRHLYAGAGTTVVLVDTSTGKVTKRISTAANVEQPRYDPVDGMVYVTTPATDQLVQLDPNTGLVSRTYKIAKCHPTGLAINAARQLAMLACGGSIATVNLRSGAQDVTRVVQGGDVVTYDAMSDRFVVASPHGTNDSAVGVFAGDGRFIGSVATTPDAHAAVYDDAHGFVYAPSKAGLMSFAPEACAPPPEWVNFVGGLSIFAVPLLAAAAFLLLYARRRRRGRGGPTMRELQDEDLANERERMRALEDSIFGPEG